MVRLRRNEKQTHRLNSRPQMWPSDLNLAMTLTLNFQEQIWNLLYLNLRWSDCHETKSKHINLKSRPQMWPMGLTLAMTLIFEFSRSYMILPNWWPRSGVRIFQIVTGVTSDVGVPSTHLVKYDCIEAWTKLLKFYRWHFQMNQSHSELIQKSLKFALMSLMSNITMLVQVMARPPVGDMPLPEPMMTNLLDAIWRHQAAMS